MNMGWTCLEMQYGIVRKLRAFKIDQNFVSQFFFIKYKYFSKKKLTRLKIAAYCTQFGCCFYSQYQVFEALTR